MKKIVSMALVLVLALSLCACGKKGATAGTYKATSVEIGDQDMLKVMTDAGLDFSCTLTLKEDGTGTLEMTDEDAQQLKWDDKTITGSDGVASPYTVDGNKLTMEAKEGDDTMKFTFEKQG